MAANLSFPSDGSLMLPVLRSLQSIQVLALSFKPSLTGRISTYVGFFCWRSAHLVFNLNLLIGNLRKKQAVMYWWLDLLCKDKTFLGLFNMLIPGLANVKWVKFTSWPMPPVTLNCVRTTQGKSLLGGINSGSNWTWLRVKITREFWTWSLTFLLL